MCRTCSAPDGTRDLIQKLRVSGVSLEDTAQFLTKQKGFAISHAAVARHELHWDKEKAGAILSDGTVPTDEEVTVKTVATHKLRLYWTANKDKIPSDNEARAWMKLLSEMAQTENEVEKMAMLRSMFRPALPSGEVIEGELVA